MAARAYASSVAVDGHEARAVPSDSMRRIPGNPKRACAGDTAAPSEDALPTRRGHVAEVGAVLLRGAADLHVRQKLEAPASASVPVAAASSKEQQQYKDDKQDREHARLVSGGLGHETTGSAGRINTLASPGGPQAGLADVTGYMGRNSIAPSRR